MIDIGRLELKIIQLPLIVVCLWIFDFVFAIPINEQYRIIKDWWDS